MSRATKMVENGMKVEINEYHEIQKEITNEVIE